MYADFEFYRDSYHGAIIKDVNTFDRLASRASVQIDLITGDKAKTYAGDAQPLKMACCAAAEKLLIAEKHAERSFTGEQELASESVGSYSRSYRSAAQTVSDATNEAKAVIEQYLAFTGLLYRGVACIRRIQ